MFSPLSNSKVHPEFDQEYVNSEDKPSRNVNFDLSSEDLYQEENAAPKAKPSTPGQRGALHSNLNTKRNLDRMGEGRLGGHVSRYQFSDATIEDAKKRGLMLDEADKGELDAIKMVKQVEIVRCMPVNIEVKRQLRERLYAQDPDFKESSCRAACYKCKLAGARRSRACKLCCLEFDASITLWKKTFKKIEGHYGSGVITYFMFLKWLLILNMMIALIMLLFIIVPEAALKAKPYHNNTEGILVEACSDLYTVNKTSDWYEHVLDFIQGTGFVEKTVVFYGYYSGMNLEGAIHNYDIKTAYLLAVVAYFVISLIFMVHNTAKGFRERVFMSHNEFRQFSNKVFGGWDFSIEDEANAALIHKSLARELDCLLQDEKDTLRRKHRPDKELVRIWTVRIVINLLVLGLLGGAGFLIYYVTVQQAELISKKKYEKQNLFVQFLIQYMTTVTIAVLNAVLPALFKIIVKAEDYSPGMTVNFTLGRTVLLKLASLGVLVSSLYLTITCDDKDQCNVGEKDCTPLRCWETYIGQEFYKLVILNLIIQIVVTFGYETVRRCVVTKVDNKLTRMVGQQEFDIPKNVLDLIYLQTLLWFGTMFCPMIPIMTVVSLIVIFYLKYFSCMKICKPLDKPIRNSQASEFFQITLLVCYIVTVLPAFYILKSWFSFLQYTSMHNYQPSAKPGSSAATSEFTMFTLLATYALCVIPVGYIARTMNPSKSCGPYRLQKHMYDVIPDFFDTFPGVVKGVLNFVTSSAFAIAAFVVLILAVYYLAQVIHTYKEMLTMMKTQLQHEGDDMQYLLKKIAKLENKEYQSPPTERRRYKELKKADKRAMREQEEDAESARVDMSRVSKRTKSATGGNNLPPGGIDDMDY